MAIDFARLFALAIKWSGRTAAVVSVVWAILLLLVAKNELHLVVWIQDDRVVYPSDKTEKQSLPLEFKGASVAAARVLTVKVSNFGKTMIGGPDRLWSLTLRAPTASHVAVLGEPRLSPRAVWARQRDTSTPNSVVFEVGAFEPRASIDLRLMVLNDRELNTRLSIEPSLPGLPREVVSRSPADHLAERLVLALWVATSLVALAVDGPSMYRKSLTRPDGTPRQGGRLVGILAARLVGVVVTAGVLAVVLSKGLGYVVSWFL